MANFVLVHGTWAGGWMWRDVAERLRAKGHLVFTPTLTSRGHVFGAFLNALALNISKGDLIAP